MHTIDFLQDLAVVMIAAGLVTILLHRFKQPVVLGYILAGFIIGPHTPPVSFITNEESINTLAEIGNILLMFSLGLEFSLGKLKKVGRTAVHRRLPGDPGHGLDWLRTRPAIWMEQHGQLVSWSHAFHVVDHSHH